MEDKSLQSEKAPSGEKGPRKKKETFWTYFKVFFWTSLGTALLFLFQILGEGATVFFLKGRGFQGEALFQALGSYSLLIVSVSDLLIFFLVWKFLSFKGARPGKVGGFSKNISLKWMVIANFTALFAFMGGNLLASLLPVSFYNNAQFFSESLEGLGNRSPLLSLLCSLLALSVIGPVTEELLFRGLPILLGKKEGGRPWAFAGIGALVFGLAHWMGGGLGLVLSGTLIGLLFAFLFLKSGSLKVSMIAHGVCNLPAALTLVFFPAPSSAGAVTAPAPSLGPSLALLFLYAALTLLGLFWLSSHPAEREGRRL